MLKLLALLTMVIDHVGYALFPEQEWMRIVGRLAFPLFAYHIALGIIHTSDIKKYMHRLFTFGLISIIPYYLLFDMVSPNIILSFFFTVFLVYLWEKKEMKMLATFLFAAMYFLSPEYGYYGIITILLFKEKIFWLFIPLTIGKSMLEEWSVQLYAIFALPLIYYADRINGLIDIKINRSFFYWFYPVHLFVIYLIALIVK